MAQALCAWAIKGRKNSLHNLPYGPCTRLIRCIYFALNFATLLTSTTKNLSARCLCHFRWLEYDIPRISLKMFQAVTLSHLLELKEAIVFFEQNDYINQFRDIWVTPSAQFSSVNFVDHKKERLHKKHGSWPHFIRLFLNIAFSWKNTAVSKLYQYVKFLWLNI